MLYRFHDYAHGDAEGVLAVFNHFIEHSFAAYPTEKVGPEFAARLAQVQRDGYAVITVRGDDGRVLGFGLLRAFHPAGSFRRTGEIGYFLHPSATGQGIGSALLELLLQRGRAMGLRTVLASISSRNEQSLAFHRKHGFEEVGRFRAIGEKFGEDFDVVYTQRSIGREPGEGNR
ncbi:MAG: GCN5-related N-acetyltransferase [Acidobacteria bacterium]|nr:GCN5-related N-acetyltransferase [Acidobacteriota bacterium]